MVAHRMDEGANPPNDLLESQMNQLLAEAEELPKVPLESTEAYEQATASLVAAVDASVLSDADIERLRGGLPLRRLHDNHVHHAGFMGVVFRFGTHRLLARILPWVYRSYHRHGVDFAYFPLELHAWQRSIRDQLGEESMAEILRIYDWMIASHERIIQLSDLPSPFGPLPSEYQWQDFAECLLAGDWRRALALTDAHEAPDRRIDFFEHAVRNSMYDIGCRWEDGQVSVAYEHLATASVARLLSALPPTLPPAGQKKGKAIVTATDNEFHEMGAWLVADALEADGWTVRFLGANTPRQELMDMVSLDTPDILLLSATMPPNLRHVEGTIRSIRQLPGCADLPVLVGGLAFAEEPDLYRRVGADATAADCRGAVQQARLCWGGGNAEH